MKGVGLYSSALSSQWENSSEAACHHCSERHILPGGLRGEGIPHPSPLGLLLFLTLAISLPSLEGYFWVLLQPLFSDYIPLCAQDQPLTSEAEYLVSLALWHLTGFGQWGIRLLVWSDRAGVHFQLPDSPFVK